MMRIRRWPGALLLTAASVLATEGALQFISHHVYAIERLLSASGTIPLNVPDSLLDVRGNSRWPDHDSRGFRNARAVERADVVTIGDSHTYGVGVDRSHTWPYLLGVNTGLVTYNISFGGWSPGQGFVVLNQALLLQPSTVVFGLYLGNDLLDVFKFVGRRPGLWHYLPPALKDTAAALESTDPIADRVRFLFALGDTTTQGSPGPVRRYLSSHSKLYGLARAVRRSIHPAQDTAPAILSRNMDQSLAGMTARQRSFVSVYRGADWQTLLTPKYRNLVMDVGDPRIRAGLNATEGLLASMDSTCRRQQIRFLVVILPTKESVFASRIRDTGKYESLDSMVSNERRIRVELVAWLEDHHVEVLDVVPALVQSIAQPYFENVDGHPNEVGHQVIANAVTARLRLAE